MPITTKPAWAEEVENTVVDEQVSPDNEDAKRPGGGRATTPPKTAAKSPSLSPSPTEAKRPGDRGRRW
jgi:hypothetical protein